MRCRNCDYRLWNIPSRTCPECGTPFTPSQYEFAPNAVQFCCPHCDQPYYGTSSVGHLVPHQFNCARCGQAVHMDQMVLRPAEGVDEERTHGEKLPWLDRNKVGFFRGFFATTWMTLIRPSDAMRAIPTALPLGTAWWYCTLVVGFTTLCVLLPMLLLMALVGVMGGGAPGAIGAVIGMAVFGGFVVLGTLVFVLIWGATTHLLLNWTAQPAGPSRRTYQAILVSSGAFMASLVPCIGWYFGWIWWPVSAVLMVREGQKVSGGKAALATLAWPVVSLVLGAALYVGLIVTAMMAPMAFATAPTSEIQGMTMALQSYAAANQAAYPLHAIDLVSSFYTTTDEFASFSTMTMTNNVPLADSTLLQYDSVLPSKQIALRKSAAGALPANVVAHRLGDFVFCYHGLTPTTTYPASTGGGSPWIVIQWPDPAQNPPPAGTDMIGIGRSDGTALVVPFSRFVKMLDAENDRRESIGLPPIPMPQSITHAAPAVADVPADP